MNEDSKQTYTYKQFTYQPHFLANNFSSWCQWILLVPFWLLLLLLFHLYVIAFSEAISTAGINYQKTLRTSHFLVVNTFFWLRYIFQFSANMTELLFKRFNQYFLMQKGSREKQLAMVKHRTRKNQIEGSRMNHSKPQTTIQIIQNIGILQK